MGSPVGNNSVPSFSELIETLDNASPLSRNSENSRIQPQLLQSLQQMTVNQLPAVQGIQPQAAEQSCSQQVKRKKYHAAPSTIQGSDSSSIASKVLSQSTHSDNNNNNKTSSKRPFESESLSWEEFTRTEKIVKSSAYGLDSSVTDFEKTETNTSNNNKNTSIENHNAKPLSQQGIHSSIDFTKDEDLQGFKYRLTAVELCLHRNNIPKAIAKCQQIIDSVKATPLFLAYAYQRMGRVYLAQSRGSPQSDEAIKNALLYFELASAQFQFCNPKDNPDYINTLIELIKIYLSVDKSKAFFPVFAALSSKVPNSKIYKYAGMYEALCKNNFKKALEYFSKSQELTAKNSYIKHSEAYLLQGLVYIWEKNESDALSFFKRAVECYFLDPQNLVSKNVQLLRPEDYAQEIYYLLKSLSWTDEGNVFAIGVNAAFSYLKSFVK